MKFDHRDENFTLSTGKRFYANCGILGLGPGLDVSHGYDAGLWHGDYARFTPAEQAEICDYMIALWQERKAIVEVLEPADETP